jgi:hypothetical protein
LIDAAFNAILNLGVILLRRRKIAGLQSLPKAAELLFDGSAAL